MDLLAVQGTLKRLLQYHSSKASVLQLSGFSGFPGGSDGKASVYNAGDLGSIPGSGRFPGEVNDNPLQYLAWRIPWTEAPGGLQSMGLQRVRHD